MWRAAALAFCLAAAPAHAQQTDSGLIEPAGVMDFSEALPEGYPPKMGDVAGRLDRRPVAWETFDFSVGAFDASAWIDKQGKDSLRLTINAYPPGDPDTDDNRLSVVALFDALPTPGSMTASVTVEILDRWGKKARLASARRPATLTIDSITVGNGSGYGRASGQITARLCPMGGKSGPCRDFSARFDTVLQYEGL